MPADARPLIVAGLRLVVPVGRGAEGEVWEARDSRGRRRALKLIRPDSLVDPSEVQRRGSWLVEVEHPALVRVWRTGVLRGGGLDGWGFVEMTFVDGRSMHGVSALAEALERLEPLAEGLDLLHAGAWSEGVPLVHRDVKPANLIETPEGGLVLVDHSTLRAVGAETVTRIGTPVFAAPEVMSGRMGPPADVYSFCATAVALLTGARGDALAELLARPAELDVPAGIRAGLRDRPGDRPWCCRAALEVEGFVTAEPLTEIMTVPMPPPARDEVAATEALPPVPEALERTDPLEVPAVPEVAGRDRTRVYEPDHLPGEPDHLLGEQDHLLGEPGHPPGEAEARPGPWPVAGWLAVLALLAATPAVLAWLDLPLWPDTAVALGVAAFVHLASHGARGRHVRAAIVAPPLAWAFLLSELVAPPGRRRDWALPLLLGALSVVTAAVLLAARLLAGRLALPEVRDVLAEVPGGDVSPEVVVIAAAASLALLAVTAATARRGGLAMRLLLVPVWASGALVLLAGGALLLPLALPAGRAPALLRRLGRTLTGTAALLRPDHRPTVATAGDGPDSRAPEPLA